MGCIFYFHKLAMPYYTLVSLTEYAWFYCLKIEQKHTHVDVKQ